MAASHTICLILVLITSFISLIQTGLSYDPPIGSPINYAERPLSSYEKYLENCDLKLHPFCGSEIFSSAIYGNQTVSDGCCKNLVNDLGQKCHEDITKYIVSFPKFKTNKILIWQRSKKVWNDCASRSLNISPVGAVDANVFT
jgi:hypothetical protein